MAVEKETEEKIFNAAQIVFQEKGFAGARMQEIADEAGINKSMLHYYYRSKEKLFLQVFRQSVQKIFPRLLTILESADPLEEKVERIIDFYFRTFDKNPALPAFVTHEMNQHPDRFREFMLAMGVRLPESFTRQIQKEAEAGRIRPMEPVQFVTHIVSLCIMPFVARNMLCTLFQMDEQQYQDFLIQRKEMLPDLIFNGIRS